MEDMPSAAMLTVATPCRVFGLSVLVFVWFFFFSFQLYSLSAGRVSSLHFSLRGF